MKRKITCTLFIVLFIGLGQQLNVAESEQDVALSTYDYPSLNFLSAEDLDWTAVTMVRGNDYTLLDTTSGDSFNYSITDSLITIQEGLSDDAFVGVYATVPVTNNHLAFSCEMRVTAEHVDARNGVIKLYDPVSLRRMDVTPIIAYRKDNTYDSGFNHIGMNYTISEFDEAIIFIYYSDGWLADWNQTVYVKDLRIYNNEEFPLSCMPKNIHPIDEYNWTAINTDNWNFGSLPSPPLIDLGDEGFTYDVNGTYLHLQEIDSGTNDSFCGVYTTIPVVNHTASFSFEGKAKSNSVDVTPNLKIAIYDTNTSEMIQGIPDIGCWNENLTETEFNYFEFSLLVPGYTKVDLFFFYNDVSALNDQHEFWIKNFKTYNASFGDTPVIKTSGEISFFEGSLGNYINWTIFDVSTGTYALYRNDTLVYDNDWVNGEFISINVDELIKGIYIYNIVATNAFGYQTERMVFVIVMTTIEISETTTSPHLYLILLSISFFIPILHRRRKKT